MGSEVKKHSKKNRIRLQDMTQYAKAGTPSVVFHFYSSMLDNKSKEKKFCEVNPKASRCFTLNLVELKYIFLEEKNMKMEEEQKEEKKMPCSDALV